MDLKDKNLYYIGGVVRDKILGLNSVDIDLVYNGDAIEFAKTIDGAKIIQINEPFGTVKIEFGGQQTDIASTRSESYPQKGHLPVVDKIGCDLKEDVLRRDFTINALAKSTLTGEIIDYTGGMNDIKNKILRVLYDASFIDDPTRILRGLKFAVRFGFELDEHTRKLQDDYLNNINYDMSYKRLKKELIETFNLNSACAFERFIEQKIYKLISPLEFKCPHLKEYELLINKYKPNNIWIMYVGLLPDISSLPLTKEENQIVDGYKNLLSLEIDEKSTKLDIYKAFKGVPFESVLMYSNINAFVVNYYLEHLKSVNLLISGKDLQKLGIPPSAKYQSCFEYILARKLDNPDYGLSDEKLLAKEYFNL